MTHQHCALSAVKLKKFISAYMLNLFCFELNLSKTKETRCRPNGTAWGGFLSVELVNRINVFFRRLQRFDCLQCCAELMNMSNYNLLFKLCALTHDLNHLLSSSRNCDHLRARRHFYI